MAVRKRFSTAERELLTAGVPLQVQNVTQWHDWSPMHSPVLIERDNYGWERAAGTIDRTRGTVRAGDPFPVTPGHVRARAGRDRDILRARAAERPSAARDGRW